MLCTRSQQRDFGCIDAVQLGVSIMRNADGVWPTRIDFGLVAELHFTLDEVGRAPVITVILLQRDSVNGTLAPIPIYTSDMPAEPVSGISKLVQIDPLVEDDILAHLAGGRVYVAFPFDAQVLPAAGIYVVATSVDGELAGRTAFRIV